MADKHRRHEAIRRLVQSSGIPGQNELLKELRKLRMRVDQSTLSRDLQELGVRKSDGVYALNGWHGSDEAAVERPDHTLAVRSFRTCGPHLIVLRTSAGQAQPIGVFLDGQQDCGLAGTIAGDDTLFVATTSRRTQTVALRWFRKWFGEANER
jgi:transcriptional regulator of arginine metabolism